MLKNKYYIDKLKVLAEMVTHNSSVRYDRLFLHNEVYDNSGYDSCYTDAEYIKHWITLLMEDNLNDSIKLNILNNGNKLYKHLSNL